MALTRMLPKWCSAARVSPSLAARVPCAQRRRSCTGSASTPSGWPGRLVEVGEERVVLGVGSALEGGEDGEPAERGGGELPLPGAGAEGERLLGVAAQRGPPAGDDLGEAEPGQRVQDEHAGAGIAGAGDHRGEAAVVGVVVAEVQGGVAEVGQQVEVGDVGAGIQRGPQRLHGGCPFVGGGAGEGEQEVAEAAGPLACLPAMASAASSGDVSRVVPLSAPYVLSSAAATASSSARFGSSVDTARAAAANMWCASVADPTLTSMRPRSRSMSARSTRSSASSRAAAASVRAAVVCPAAHAVRAAAYRCAARACSSAVSSAARW